LWVYLFETEVGDEIFDCNPQYFTANFEVIE
jgi:hypothetical protein